MGRGRARSQGSLPGQYTMPPYIGIQRNPTPTTCDGHLRVMGACVPVVNVRELALRSYWATSEQLGPEGGQVDVRGWRFNGRHTWSSWSLSWG